MQLICGLSISILLLVGLFLWRPWETHNALNNLANNSIEMVHVAGGTFNMGCTSKKANCMEVEKPAHKVVLDDFYIGKYEVTQEQWRNVMEVNSENIELKNCNNCPIENISWEEVQEFIKKINTKTGEVYRLPTEAEWEYAARGGNMSNNYQFSGGDVLDKVAWFWKNSGDSILEGDWDWETINKNNGRTHPVGRKAPNELGLFDMTGNVGEWCQDWYNSKYYSKSAKNNPQGPSDAVNRVNRGGGWFSDARFSRVIDRHSDKPDQHFNFMGFRLARTE
ncbi:MAG: formylglycine-generating enzyme family protein [Psychroserpens sp.]